MTEFNETEKALIEKARTIEQEAKNLRKSAEAARNVRDLQSSYATRSKMYGTPEWNRETMLVHERNLQADRDRVDMFKDGVHKLREHVKKNASIYSSILLNERWTINEISGIAEVTFTLKHL